VENLDSWTGSQSVRIKVVSDGGGMSLRLVPTGMMVIVK